MIYQIENMINEVETMIIQWPLLHGRVSLQLVMLHG